jgi:hypothetical protein
MAIEKARVDINSERPQSAYSQLSYNQNVVNGPLAN